MLATEDDRGKPGEDAEGDEPEDEEQNELETVPLAAAAALERLQRKEADKGVSLRKDVHPWSVPAEGALRRSLPSRR